MLKNFYPERNDDNDNHDGNEESCFKPSRYNRN